MATGEIKYFKSEDVRVFPCAYRGYTTLQTSTLTRTIFNPEARAFTEKNFTNIYSKASANKQSFIISWGNDEQSHGLLKCVVNGYYFEISNFNSTDLGSGGTLYGYDTLIIKTVPYDFDSLNASNKTEVLESLAGGNATYLDEIVTNNTHYFTGLGLVKSSAMPSEGTYTNTLKIWDVDHINHAAFRLAEVLDTDNGESSIRTIGESSSSADGDYAIALGKTAKADDTCAIAIGEEVTAKEQNSVAIGHNAVSNKIGSAAIGTNVSTDTDYQVVIGYANTPNTDEDDSKHPIFVVGYSGNILEVSKTGDIKNTGSITSNGAIKTSSTIEGVGNLWLRGKTDSDNILTIGAANGSANANDYGELKIYGVIKDDDPETTKVNEKIEGLVFRVNNHGNISSKGTAEIDGLTTINNSVLIDGSLTAAKTGDKAKEHVLTLGSNIASDSGSIKVYGEGATAVFEVSKTGQASIADTTDATANTGALKVAGGVRIDKNLSIGTAATIGTTLTVTGKTTINDTTEATASAGALKVAGGVRINKKLNVGDTITTAGGVVGKSLTLNTNKFAVDEDGNVAAAGTFKAVGIETKTEDGKTSVDLGNATDLNAGNITTNDIKLEKSGVLKIKDIDTIRDINDLDNLFYINAGAQINGPTSLRGTVVISEGAITSESSTTQARTTTKISQSGAAYFKQKLIIGGEQEDVNIDANYTDADVADAVNAYLWVDNRRVVAGNKLFAKAGLYAIGESAIDGDLSTNSLKVTGNIDAGTVNAVSYNATSDLRKKTNIVDYIPQKSILSLPIKEFEFIGYETHTKHIGCIAQDLQKICPEIVHTDADGYLSIEESKLIYLLINEVKELKAEIKKLKGE